MRVGVLVCVCAHLCVLSCGRVCCEFLRALVCACVCVCVCLGLFVCIGAFGCAVL